MAAAILFLIMLSMADIMQLQVQDAGVYQGSIIVRLLGAGLLGGLILYLSGASTGQHLNIAVLMGTLVIATVMAIITYYYPKFESTLFGVMDVLLILGALAALPSLIIYKLAPMVLLALINYTSIVHHGLVNEKETLWVLPLEYVTALSIGGLVAFYFLQNRYEVYTHLNMAVAAKEELEIAMSRVKALSGLLPICANCKKVRNDQGYYQQIEHYISDHSEAEFTHGICPDCAAELYPNIDFKDS